MIIFARIVSVLFHPVVLVTPAVFLISKASGLRTEDALFWAGIALILAVIVSLYVFIGVKLGYFTNFDVSNRKQRIYVFPVIIIAGIVFLMSLVLFKGPSALIVSITYFIFSIAVLSLVTLKIKASVHVGSVTAAIATAVYFFGIEYIWLFMLVPVMAWARIVEKRHTLKETVVGFLFGIALATISIISVQYFI